MSVFSTPRPTSRGRVARDDSGYWTLPSRIGVWPDSVQVSGGTLFMRLPTRLRVWLSIGLRTVGHRDEAWLQRGLPCS